MTSHLTLYIAKMFSLFSQKALTVEKRLKAFSKGINKMLSIKILLQLNKQCNKQFFFKHFKNSKLAFFILNASD